MPEDIPHVIDLWKSVLNTEFCVWDEEYPSESEANADLCSGYLHVLETDGSIIGSISVIDKQDKEQETLELWKCPGHAGELSRIAVVSAYQGKKLAARMVCFGEGILKQRSCHCVRLLAAIGNIPAIRTYLNCGYMIRGEVEMYDISFLAMEKELV